MVDGASATRVGATAAVKYLVLRAAAQGDALELATTQWSIAEIVDYYRNCRSILPCCWERRTYYLRRVTAKGTLGTQPFAFVVKYSDTLADLKTIDALTSNNYMLPA